MGPHIVVCGKSNFSYYFEITESICVKNENACKGFDLEGKNGTRV